MSTNKPYYVEELFKINSEIYQMCSDYRHKELDTNDIEVRYQITGAVQEHITLTKLAFEQLYEEIEKLKNPPKKFWQFWK